MPSSGHVDVAALPEEIAAGQAGRFGHINKLPEYRVKVALKAAITARGLDAAGMNAMEILAVMSGQTADHYALHHSMLPVVRVTTTDEQIVAHGHEQTWNQTKHLGMIVPRDGAFVCRECMTNDLSDGISWFRRAHHLVGIDWCHIHGTPLLKVRAPAPFMAPPHIWAQRGMLIQVDCGRKSLDDAEEFLKRYVRVGVEMLKLKQPLPTRLTHRTLGAAAAKHGLRRAQIGAQRPLSDLVIEIAPTDWLKRHFPGLVEKAPMAYLSRVDDLLASVTPASGDSYMLALSALFSEPIACIQQLLLESGRSSSSAKAHRRTRGAEFWQGEVWAHFIRARGNYARMASELQIPVSYLGQRMRGLGLPDLTGTFSKSVWNAFDEFCSGIQLQQACAVNGTSIEQLEPLLRVAGARLAKARDRVRRTGPRQTMGQARRSQ